MCVVIPAGQGRAFAPVPRGGMRRLVKTGTLLLLLAAVAGALYVRARSSKDDKLGVKLVAVESGAITEKAIAVGQIQPRQKFSVKSKISASSAGAWSKSAITSARGTRCSRSRGPDSPGADRRRPAGGIGAGLVRSGEGGAEPSSLGRSGIMSKSTWTRSARTYELAKIALARAEQQKELTATAGSPAPGSRWSRSFAPRRPERFLTRAVNPGDPVVPLTSYQPGTEMATIADMTDLIFKGTVDEIDVGKLRAGLIASTGRGALPTDVVTGHVPESLLRPSRRREPRSSTSRSSSTWATRSSCAPAIPPTPTSSSGRRRTCSHDPRTRHHVRGRWQEGVGRSAL